MAFWLWNWFPTQNCWQPNELTRFPKWLYKLTIANKAIICKKNSRNPERKGNPLNRGLFWPCYLWCAPWYGRTSYNQLTRYPYYLACGICTRSYLSNYPSINNIYRALSLPPPKKRVGTFALKCQREPSNKPNNLAKVLAGLSSFSTPWSRCPGSTDSTKRTGWGVRCVGCQAVLP